MAIILYYYIIAMQKATAKTLKFLLGDVKISMTIKQLLKGLNYLEIKGNINKIKVQKLTFHSKEATKNSLFICITGSEHDGHSFAEQAVKNGAICLVVERFLPQLKNVVQILVANSRIAMSQLAKTFYGNASDKLKIVAVVGTNGKTSTCILVKEILTYCKKNCAIIGTDGVFANGFEMHTGLTTPDPIMLHEIFHILVARGVEYVAMEVSVQSIYYSKVYGINFEVGVLANITPEHLDFFEDFNTYKQTKLNFFKDYTFKEVFLNADCNDCVLKDVDINSGSKKVSCYGISQPADIFAIDIKTSIKGSGFVLNCKDSILEIKSRVIGVFNVYNQMVAVSVALSLGCVVQDVVGAVGQIKSLPGRYTVLHLPNNNKVIIDYCHTVKAFEEVLSLTKMLRKSGKIIALFGCVGYSDKLKRQEIGKIVGKYCDVAVLTADNPNYVPLSEINADIIEGINANIIKRKVKTTVFEEDSRQSAVALAVEQLGENDTVLLLGKGNEKYNKINGKQEAYNEFDALNAVLTARFNAQSILKN